MGIERFVGETILTCPGCGYAVAVVKLNGEGVPIDVVCADCGNFFLKESVLTRAEKRVVELLTDGVSSRNAAKALGVSVKTIESHRLMIYKKLGFHDIASLTKYAIKHGLTSLELKDKRVKT